VAAFSQSFSDYIEANLVAEFEAASQRFWPDTRIVSTFYFLSNSIQRQIGFVSSLELQSNVSRSSADSVATPS
jgi:hypothetical protein